MTAALTTLLVAIALRGRRVSVAHRVRGLPGFRILRVVGVSCGRLSFFAHRFGSRVAGVRAAWSGVPSAGGLAVAQGCGSGAGVWRGSLALAVVRSFLVWCGRGRWFRFGGGGQRLLWSGGPRLRVASRRSTLLRGLGCFRSCCGASQVAGAVAGSGSAAAGAGLGVWRFSGLGFCLFRARLAPGFLCLKNPD